MDTKRAKPDKPAVDDAHGQRRVKWQASKRRTGPYVKTRLKACNTGKTTHGKEAEEDLGAMAYNSGF
jgi:hypothetical protein